MTKQILVLSLSLLLGACFGGGEPVPQDQFYRLSNVTYHGQTLRPITGVIAVSTLDSDVLHRERSILFSHIDEPLKLQRYHYHHWTHIPAKLLQDNMVDYLRSSGVAERVIRYGVQAKVDAEIGGQLKRFERIVGGASPQVIVQIELFYKARAKKNTFFQKKYEQQLLVETTSMHATARAFSQALEKIYRDFLSDIVQQSTS